MEAARSFETPTNFYQTTWRHALEDTRASQALWVPQICYRAKLRAALPNANQNIECPWRKSQYSGRSF
jgi:hypothetical protein